MKLIKKQSIDDLSRYLDFLLKYELSQKGTAELPRKYKAHQLNGNYKDNWECHIKLDLLVVWIEVTDMEIKFVRLGTRSDLF